MADVAGARYVSADETPQPDMDVEKRLFELADQRVADPEPGVKLAKAIRAATSGLTIRTAASSVIAALSPLLGRDQSRQRLPAA